MINRDNKKAITKKGMISNRLNKFSIRKYTVGTASIFSRYDIDFWSREPRS